MTQKKGAIKQVDRTKVYYIQKGILVGAIAGVVVNLFRLGIESLLDYVVIIYGAISENPIWVVPWTLCSIAVSLFISWLIKEEPNIKGSGIPHVEGQLKGILSIKWWPVFWRKFIGGIIAPGMGLFLGREGPSIQLGAVVGQAVGEKTAATDFDKKVFIASGASAGLSAAFGAPIAGLLFITEEVYHSFSPLIWITSLTSAVTANLVTLYLFGMKPILSQGHIEVLPLRYYLSLVLFGVALGLLGFMYQRVLLSLNTWFSRLPIPPYLYPMVPFVLVIPIGLFYSDFLGGGNQIIHMLGQTHHSLIYLLLLFALRFIFSMISYGSNVPGGIFLPILTLGGILGAIMGTILVLYFGMEPELIKNFLIYGMAGYFTAIGKAPLVAIILVTEMVGNLNHLMPLAVVSLIAYIVNDFLGGSPIYEALLERMVDKDTLTIPSGKKVRLEYIIPPESRLSGQMVRDFVWPDNTLLVSLSRGKQEFFIHGDTILLIGDVLTIYTDSSIAHHTIEAIEKMEHI